MSERKVLNKYYPPDFDPIKLAQKTLLVKKLDGSRSKKKKGPKQMNVRFMMPFTMCCSSCHEFSYVGTKFNSRIEKVAGEDYLGIPIWRFYGKCPSCCSEFAFKTDPEKTAYILEFGGTRTYDPYRDESLAATVKEDFRKEMEGDAMKSLEHKTYTTANELLDLEQLDELRKMNKRLIHQTDLTDEALMRVINGRPDDGSVDGPNSAAAIMDDHEDELVAFRQERDKLVSKVSQPSAWQFAKRRRKHSEQTDNDKSLQGDIDDDDSSNDDSSNGNRDSSDDSVNAVDSVPVAPDGCSASSRAGSSSDGTGNGNAKKDTKQSSSDEIKPTRKEGDSQKVNLVKVNSSKKLGVIIKKVNRQPIRDSAARVADTDTPQATSQRNILMGSYDDDV